MQYNIGDAPLDDAPSKLKKFLDPNEEKKLSGDMRELYDRLLPTEESEARRRLLVEKLERILHQEWPGNEFNVHVFGSSGNLLCTSDSDGMS
jgi:DNA polymerase sigma